MSVNIISILIADGHPLFRDGLRSRLEKYEDFMVVAEATDDRNVLLACKEYKPKVIIIDIFMSNFFGLNSISDLHSSSPETNVLIASDSNDPIDVQTVLSDGASGYILKNSSSTEFINAIRVVANKGSYLPSSLMNELIEVTKKTNSTGNMFGLTTRELDILKELAVGKCNKEIAQRLEISVRTVETHRQNIRQKTGMYSNTDLMKIADRLGLNLNAAEVL